MTEAGSTLGQTAGEGGGEPRAPESRSPWQLALRRFRRNRPAVVCLVLLALLGFSTLAVPWVSPRDYRKQDYKSIRKGPNPTYWMGTDRVGRDLMVRVFRGGRISFAVGLLATGVAIGLGISYGAISGLAGGRVDLLMMRVVDVFYGLPYMIIVIIAMTFLPRSFVVLFLVLGCFSWMTTSRIVRGQVLVLKELAFVEAARAMGVTWVGILARHLVPNLLGPVIVYATLTVPSVMLQESFLSFLGLGVSEPETSWGVLIAEGASALDFWWLVVFPGGMLAATLFCLNMIGDGLRDAIDVTGR
ncbi:MAG: ABC transporter permease [Planctomycetes bacterium]|nr:ABC transporter permease [Planctomycetota bacterium]